MAEWRTEVSSLALQIAAKNCRRRKIDQISVLEETEQLEENRRRVTDRLEGLDHFILSSLGEGEPLARSQGAQAFRFVRKNKLVFKPFCSSLLSS